MFVLALSASSKGPNFTSPYNCLFYYDVWILTPYAKLKSD